MVKGESLRVDEMLQEFVDFKRQISKEIEGFSENGQKEEFIDRFLLQLYILWSLQQRGILPHRFHDLLPDFTRNSSHNIKNYFAWLCNELKDYDTLAQRGKIINQLGHSDRELNFIPILIPISNLPQNLVIPDELFYGSSPRFADGEGIGITRLPTPIYSFFEYIEKQYGQMSEFFIGCLYERLISLNERKETGTFYTPREITDYMTRLVVDRFLFQELEQSQPSYIQNGTSLFEFIAQSSEDQLLLFLHILQNLTICDPAVGSGHFLIAALDYLTEIYCTLRESIRKQEYHILLDLNLFEVETNGIPTNLFAVENENDFRFLVKRFLICPRNLYGIDIDPQAIEIAKFRLFVSSLLPNAEFSPLISSKATRPSKIHLYVGNALFEISSPSSGRQERDNKARRELGRKTNYDLYQGKDSFPEVFQNSGGFQIILGNPPYLNFKSTKSGVDEDEKDRIMSKFGILNDIYEAFIHRSFEYIAPKGLICLLIPYNFHKYLGPRLTSNLVQYDNLGENLFRGISTSVCIVLLSKKMQEGFKFGNYIHLNDKLNQLGRTTYQRVLDFHFPQSHPIISYITEHSQSYQDLRFEIARGEERGRRSLETQKLSEYIPIFSAAEMIPYTLREPTLYINPVAIEKQFYGREKIGVNLAFRNRIKASWIGKKVTIKSILCIFKNTSIKTPITPISPLTLHQNPDLQALLHILGLWNAKIYDYFHQVRYSQFEERRVNTITNIRKYYPLIIQNQEITAPLVQHLIQTKTQNSRIIKILDLLYYEVFFIDKFVEDGIYPLKNYYYAQTLTKLLDQEVLNKSITSEKTWQTISQNSQLMHLEAAILSHPWIQTIENAVTSFK